VILFVYGQKIPIISSLALAYSIVASGDQSIFISFPMIIFPACENYLQSDQGKRLFGPEVASG
jgi:hypothetical protein